MGLMEQRHAMIAAQPHLATGSGSILIAEPKIERLAVTFRPIQAGSGNPSPTNVRAISGHSTITVSLGSQTESVSLGDTYYGGTVDLVSGVLTVDRIGIDLSTITDWTIDAHYRRVYVIRSDLMAVANNNDVPDGMVCNRLKTVASQTLYAQGAFYEGISISTGKALQLHIDGLTNANPTLAQVNSYFSNNPTFVVAKLATAQTVQLTAQTINAIRGTQAVSSADGTVSVTYWTH